MGYQNRQDPFVLAQTVMKAWALFPVKTIGKIKRRWLRVLDSIKLGKEGNRFVKSFHGKLTNNHMVMDNEEDTAFAT